MWTSRNDVLVPPTRDATTCSELTTGRAGEKTRWNWFTPACECPRYTSAVTPWVSATSEMLGSDGRSGCPRLGENAWATTVLPAKSSTGIATETASPLSPRKTRGGRTRARPLRPNLTRRKLLSTTMA